MMTRPALFKWRQTETGIILCAVRWYLRYSLSLRDVEELLDERGLYVDHTTVWRWVQDYGPELEQRLRRHLKPTNKSWRVDETYLRVKGRWCYLYRAIDSKGATIDFLLSAFRDADAAKRLFRKALGDPSHRQPRVINTDLAPIYSSAIPDSKKEGTLRKRCRHRTGAVREQHSRTGSLSHQTSRERQAGLPRIPGGAANDSRLRSSPHDPEGASSMGGRR
jgi:transposase-like protein